MDAVIAKFSLFHPLISNSVAVICLGLAVLLGLPFVRSFRDLAYYWYLRPILTITLSSLFRFLLLVGGLRSYLDLSAAPWPLQVVVLYLWTDFFIYLTHILMHRSRWLFRFHKTHHLIEELSWENGSKDTWVFESFVMFHAVVGGVLLGAELYITATTIFLWKLALALTHFPRPLPWRWLRFLIVSPDKHLAHHTEPNRDFFNYATTIPLWDQLARALATLAKRIP